MTERRKGLGRGLGALIPSTPAAAAGGSRPVDVFFGGGEPVRSSTAVAERPIEDSRPGPADPTDTVLSAGVQPDDAAVATTDPSDPDAALVPVAAEFRELPIDSIRPNPKQPRTVFDDEDLAELVASILEVGVLQPVVVRSVADGYELVMGERRWRACREAGLSHVPAIIRATPDNDLLRDALLENLHRSQLNPLEEAAAYDQLLKDFGCGHEELASRIGRSRPQISNTLRLLKLPSIVQRRVAAGVLSAGHARALLGLVDHAKMERLAQRIVAEGLSVRATEEIVALGGDEDDPRPRRVARTTEPDERLEAIAARLGDRLDTRVKIAMGARRGRLTVEFGGAEDLQRILDLLAPESAG